MRETRLSDLDEVAFQKLLSLSLRPVDDGFVERNRAAFARLIERGITSEVIVRAYEDYVRWQTQQMAELGEMRPQHLLHWLMQPDNGNIAYVLKARSGALRQAHTRMPRRQAPSASLPRIRRQEKSPEAPHLEYHRFGQGRGCWSVTDRHGRRWMNETRDNPSEDFAMDIYERLYRDGGEVERG